ncbi:MAG: hypothetical protein RJP95_01460 [Pirellulales bacterium]
MSKDDAPVTAPEVMKLIEEEVEPDLYCDHGYHPQIRFVDDHFERSWPVDSERTRGWIAELCHRNGLYPTPTVIRQVITILQGMGWNNIRETGDTGLLAVYEDEPLIEAVESLMSDQRCYEKSASELLVDLELQNDRLKWHARWPKSASALTRRLRERRDILGELGLCVTTRHVNRGTVVRITKSNSLGDDDAVTPQ